MASGVKVHENCLKTFDALVKERKFRCAVFKINDAMTEVTVERTLEPGTAGSAQKEWEDFRSTLPEDDCRFFTYDFSFEHQGATKTRVLFVLWSPEYSKVRAKMIYASSQEGVVNKLNGIQRQLQCTDAEEVEYERIAKALAAHTAGY